RGACRRWLSASDRQTGDGVCDAACRWGTRLQGDPWAGRLVSGPRRRSFGGDLQDDLEAEILLDRPVERLPVTDPKRVQSRIGSDLCGSRLAQLEALWMGRCDEEGLVQFVLPGGDRHGGRPLTVVHRQILSASNAM